MNHSDKHGRRENDDSVPAATSPGRGNLFIVSAPSGAGKTTLCKAVLDRFPDMIRSVSYTTRPPRKGERDGRDYFFIDEEEFRQGMKSGRWLEWARVHDNYYGTSADFVENNLAAGRDVLFNIDVQGMGQITARFPGAITVFILPPSLEELRRRLEKRGQDSAENIQLRLAAAKTEMAEKDRYHHVVLNDDLETAVNQLVAIVESYRGRHETAFGEKRPDDRSESASAGKTK